MAMVAAGGPVTKQPAPASSDEIAKLIESLGDKDYAVRQRAEEDLARIGFPAYEALKAATQHQDFEIAARARYVLRKIQTEFTSDQDPPAVRLLLEDYGRSSATVRVMRIQRLAWLPDLKGTAALCRLVRGEPSASFSACAALAILCHEPFDQPSRLRLKELARANLVGSKRPAAEWVLTYLRLREDPVAAMPEWTRLVESEYARWQQTGPRANAETVVGLLYLLAESQAEGGDRATAEQTVGRARRLPLPSDSTGIVVRRETLSMLARRGSSAWFEAECHALVDSGRPDLVSAFGLVLAEYLHDQGKDLAAVADVREVSQPARRSPWICSALT